MKPSYILQKWNDRNLPLKWVIFVRISKSQKNCPKVLYKRILVEYCLKSFCSQEWWAITVLCVFVVITIICIKEAPIYLWNIMIIIIIIIIISPLGILMISCSALIAYGEDYILRMEWWAITILCILLVIIIICVIIMLRQPQNIGFITFKVWYDFFFQKK